MKRVWNLLKGAFCDTDWGGGGGNPERTMTDQAGFPAPRVRRIKAPTQFKRRSLQEKERKDLECGACLLSWRLRQQWEEAVRLGLQWQDSEFPPNPALSTEERRGEFGFVSKLFPCIVQRLFRLGPGAGRRPGGSTRTVRPSPHLSLGLAP